MNSESPDSGMAAHHPPAAVVSEEDPAAAAGGEAGERMTAATTAVEEIKLDIPSTGVDGAGPLTDPPQAVPTSTSLAAIVFEHFTRDPEAEIMNFTQFQELLRFP